MVARKKKQKNTTKKKKSKKTKKEKKEKKTKEKKERKWTKDRILKLINLPEAIDIIERIAGDDGYTIFKELLLINKMIDEFTLADKAGLQINYARSLLYKLYEHKLVEFTRERDKKKGWFIYSWKAHPEKLKELIIEEKLNEIEKLKKEITPVEGLFICKNCGKTYDYSKAMELMFFCEVCGGHLEAESMEKLQERINNQIEKVKERIKEIQKI